MAVESQHAQASCCAQVMEDVEIVDGGEDGGDVFAAYYADGGKQNTDRTPVHRHSTVSEACCKRIRGVEGREVPRRRGDGRDGGEEPVRQFYSRRRRSPITQRIFK